MTILCKNCSYNFDGNYCPECGQKAKTSKIDLSYVQEEAKYTLLHLNNGFFYTTKELLRRPGHTTREFIEGKRVRHYKPILYLFVLAGLYGFLLHYIDITQVVSSGDDSELAATISKGFEWMAGHYSLIELFYLPITAFVSWLAFYKWEYNYIEHIIINAYGAGLRLTVQIIAFPILYFVKGSLFYFMLSGLVNIVTLLLTGWLYIQFFNSRPIEKTILRLILTGIYLVVVTILITIAGTGIYIKYFA